MKLLSILISSLTFILYHRPRHTFTIISLWMPKLLAGALSPIMAVISAAMSVYGFFKRDWGLTGAGAANAALNAYHIRDIGRNRSRELFDNAFGPEWPMLIPPEVKIDFMPQPYQPFLPIPQDVIFQQDLVVGEKFEGGPLLADLWQPKANAYRSGLAILYTHGGAWRYGAKDMMTRPQFKRLAHQGHVILDIDYSISEDTPIQEMVRETKQALLWLKQHADAYGVDPERIVLMGSSAGGQLALLTAYTPGHLAFQPHNISGDESVHGVIAFYPPVDFLQLYRQSIEQYTPHSGKAPDLNPMDWVYYLLLKFLGLAKNPQDITPDRNFFTRLLGGTPQQLPELYQLLSPINHVSPTSPATLTVIGEHDFFRFNTGAHNLHFKLKSLGVPSSLLELPRTDHAFDIVLTQLSPSAQSAIFHYERFLGVLAGRDRE